MTVDPPLERACTIWLTGLSGAGKTTLAEALAMRLRSLGRRVELLDGDEVRQSLSSDLGFSREDRDQNARRIGFVARLLTRNGVFVVTATISPYREARERARAAIRDFVEVHVDTPLEVCEARDPKGLYARARRGEVARFTGVSDPYEPPLSPELRLDPRSVPVDVCVARVLACLRIMGYLPAED